MNTGPDLLDTASFDRTMHLKLKDCIWIQGFHGIFIVIRSEIVNE